PEAAIVLSSAGSKLRVGTCMSIIIDPPVTASPVRSASASGSEPAQPVKTNAATTAALIAHRARRNDEVLPLSILPLLFAIVSSEEAKCMPDDLNRNADSC